MAGIPYKKLAIATVLFTMAAMLFLTMASVIPTRNADPYSITYNGQTAVDGWRVAQDYGIMDAHTLLGNGAYFGPDLTGIASSNGQAWVRAWLENPTRFPTNSSVSRFLPQNMTLDQYYAQYPGAFGDVQARGGNQSLMPNLSFTAQQKDGLVAFLTYISLIKTNGWPPGPGQYTFSGSYQEYLGLWPESSNAWVVYWLLATALTAVILFLAFHWLTRGEELD